MSLIYCPECGHEVSVNALACPGCGRPIAPQPVAENVVMIPREDKSIPPWAYALIGLSAISLILAAVVFLRQGPSDDANVNVNVAARRTAGNSSLNSSAASEPLRETRSSTVASTDAPTVSVPAAPVTRTSSIPSTTVSEPSAPAPPPDRGTVKITAKIEPRSGAARAAGGARFYLLDKDVQSILSEARVEPIDGNDLAASLGLAAVDPGRYADFQRRAMRAISSHAKSSATTSPNGSASFSGVAPNQYYLFGVMRVGTGFAFWNAPVSVTAGEKRSFFRVFFL